jgi:hypothetical protein
MNDPALATWMPPAGSPPARALAYVALGEALARAGELTPAVVGDAARTGRYDPQDLKKVWHYIARFGAPDLAGDQAGHVQGAA